jgi:hypothetical protein
MWYFSVNMGKVELKKYRRKGFGVDAHLGQKGVDSTYRNSLYCNDLKLQRP